MKTPISLVIQRFLPLKPRGSRMLGYCPFHTDAKAHLWVDDEAESFLCAVCGAYGDADHFVELWNCLPAPTFDELRELNARLLAELNRQIKLAESLRFTIRDNFASRALSELIGLCHAPDAAAALAYDYADAALIVRAPK